MKTRVSVHGKILFYIKVIQTAGTNITDCQLDSVNGSNYRGAVSKTTSGKVCQKWSSQSPHEHSYTPLQHPSSGKYCSVPLNKSLNLVFLIEDQDDNNR